MWGLVRNLVALTFSVACAATVLAQVPPLPQPQNPPATQPAQQTAQQPAAPPVSRPIGVRTVGLEAGKLVRWTLRDAVMAALDKNVDIDIERENVRLAQFDIDSARSVYDPLTTSFINYQAVKSPNAFVFSGTTSNFVQRDTLTYNFGMQQLVERGGGNYSINFNNTRTGSNTNNFSPQFSPNLALQYVQPLWRNLKFDNNRRQIKIAKKALDLSDAVFRQRAIEIISRVQQAYWDLAVAIRDEEIQRDAVKLAETQLNNNQRQVEVGTLAPIDVVSAATQLESRRLQVFQAMNAVAQAENQLKTLTVDSPAADLWSAQIVPVEPFEVQQIALPLTDALKLAFSNRPELKQYSLQKEMNEVDVDYYRNALKPQIDLVLNYNIQGLGGTPREGVPAGVIFPEFVGGYGTSLKELFKNEFRTWSVGISFSLPLRNRAAKAGLGKALEADRRLDLQTRGQMQSIEVEVRNAVQSVETAKMRIEASAAARDYAQQQLDGETKRFQAGLSSTFLILTRQNDLVQARGAEQRALADYNKAVAELQRAISTTLSSNNIEVKSQK
jgi:HAE1 family hydrophobic/amphiphilic exporter-1